VSPSTVIERVEHVRLLVAAACARVGRSPDSITLIAVAKGIEPGAIREAVAAGIGHLGENRIQQAQAKFQSLSDLRTTTTRHMIGHLQTNKVKDALALFDIIHSVDSIHLAVAISRRALKPAPVFLEVNVSEEATKYGFPLDELPRSHELISRLKNISVRGLMTVAPLSEHAEYARPVFRRLRESAAELGLPELSMGMTDDFEVAIEEGATHVRIGRAIFGERP